jgi:hypothetical protein
MHFKMKCFAPLFYHTDKYVVTPPLLTTIFHFPVLFSLYLCIITILYHHIFYQLTALPTSISFGLYSIYIWASFQSDCSPQFSGFQMESKDERHQGFELLTTAVLLCPLQCLFVFSAFPPGRERGEKEGGGGICRLLTPMTVLLVQAMMKALKLPKDLRSRINNYYDYYSHRHKAGIDHAQVFFDLSAPLAKEIALCLHCEQVQNTPFFQDCQPHFLVALVQKLHVRIFLPGDYIIVIGQFAQEMYFIRTGKVLKEYGLHVRGGGTGGGGLDLPFSRWLQLVANPILRRIYVVSLFR